MVDSGEDDTKIIAVNVGDPRYDHIKVLEDLPLHYLVELQNFFSTYKTLQGRETIVERFFDIETAVRYLEEAKARFITTEAE